MLKVASIPPHLIVHIYLEELYGRVLRRARQPGLSVGLQELGAHCQCLIHKVQPVWSKTERKVHQGDLQNMSDVREAEGHEALT